MTMEQRERDALEIVQTRALSAQEKRELGHLWDKVIWRDGVGPVSTISFYLWYGFAAFLTVSVLMAIKTLNVHEPNLGLQLAIAALGFALALAFTNWFGRRLHYDKIWSAFDVGDRYTLAADGLEMTTRRGLSRCHWSNIETVINDDRRLMAVLAGNGGLFVLKAAFESQDVERFGAELVRRWQASRGTSHSGLAQ
jgi:hypothetical protein